jgi:hypothetical protein
MSVKRTIGITLSVILLVGVASNTIPAYAEELKEMYVDYAQDVQIVITNKPCIKWETPKDVQLNYAYAVNLKNKDMITGCYTHDDKNIIIQLTDESNKKHYEFKITPEAFKSRSTL